MASEIDPSPHTPTSPPLEQYMIDQDIFPGRNHGVNDSTVEWKYFVFPIATV